MKITIESTAKIVTLCTEDGDEIQARVWQGHTESGISGIPVLCFVTRIAPEIPKTNPHIDEFTAEFERDLKRQADPRITVDAIPFWFII